MPSHICACHFGKDGRCIWCGLGPADKQATFGPQPLPPPVSYGDSKQAPVYKPFSPWGRAQARRSAVEFMGKELAAIVLGTLEEEDNPKPLSSHEDNRPDAILGRGLKRFGADRPLPKSGPWSDFATDVRR